MNKHTRWSHGSCPNCGDKNDRFPKWYCSKCLAKHNQRSSQYTLDRIAQGVCPACGGVMDNALHATCSSCKEVMRLRIKSKRETHKNNRQCYDCGIILMDPHKLCEACKQKRKERKERRCELAGTL